MFWADDIEDGKVPDLYLKEPTGAIFGDIRITNAVGKQQELGIKHAAKDEKLKKSVYEKNKKYKDRTERLGITFIPMIMTSQGNAAPGYAQLMNKVMDLKSKESNIPLAALHQYWGRRRSVRLQTCVARVQMVRAATLEHSRQAAEALRLNGTDESNWGDVVEDQNEAHISGLHVFAGDDGGFGFEME